MPKKIQRSLSNYLSKIKTPASQIQLPSRKWILSACRHPRTPSFSLDNSSHGPNNKKDDEATLADIDRFLQENFKSMYLEDHEETDNNNPNIMHKTETVVSEEETPKLNPILFDSSGRFSEPSRRDLFVSAETNTTGDEASSSTLFSTTTLNDSSEESAEDQKVAPDNCVVVLASSGSPYEDFRRSMEGVVEARLRNCEKVDWDFMEELLFCHISLNQKKSHRFILSAFADLITAMRRPPETDQPPKTNARSVRTIRSGKEVTKKTKEVILEFESL
ncbi:hypothetical protein VNO77_06328 [Canavalia gladiata]|uniref:Transcription repressor n=1 Tax=Canavalia gladiata TaxID=3824 RepID=A0AAN9R002_CANGL